jgi:hypothetical protein
MGAPFPGARARRSAGQRGARRRRPRIRIIYHSMIGNKVE